MNKVFELLATSITSPRSSFTKTSLIQPNVSNTIWCPLNEGSVVNRDKKSKYYVSEDVYPEKSYPTYCDGPAYLFTIDVVIKIASIERSVPSYRIFEDVVITGILPKQFNVSLVKIDQYTARDVLNTWNIGAREDLKDKLFFFMAFELKSKNLLGSISNCQKDNLDRSS